jgi:hypothetical protein
LALSTLSVGVEAKESLFKVILVMEDIPLFHIVHATMNMVKAKIAPMIVQQTSVDFLFLSSTGNWVG